MATLDDVRALALALPEAVESTSYGAVAWKVRGKTFVWERPLRRRDIADLEALGERVPDGDLVELERIDVEELRELVTDGWVMQAPKRLGRGYLDSL